MTTTSWGRSLADDGTAPVPLRRPGDDAIPATPANVAPPTDRRCAGTRTITAVIPLADAVLLDDRLCPGCRDCAPVTHAEHALAEQQLAEAVERAHEALARPSTPHGVEP